MAGSPTGSTPSMSIAELQASGVGGVIGTVVNPAGLTLAKAVPVDRTAVFADPGLGASPTWHGFAIDKSGIAFTEAISVVGDQRVRIDAAQLRLIGGGMAWAPGSFFDQDGAEVPECARGTLARTESRLAAAGLRARVGHEIEFVLVAPDGSALPGEIWAQYGLAGVLEHEGFARDVIDVAATAGVAIEQFHPEYGVNQFEISLAPDSPVAAADQLVLTRLLVARAARNHGVRVSFSPVPFAGAVGNGAHQHVSLWHSEGPLFSGGTGAQDMTARGESALAGILRGLAEAQAICCGSIVSGLRMRPGNWSGAYICWGTENREAAVRFIRATAANADGANIEVKIVDPSANPYFATAAVLGLALEGIETAAQLPAEVTVDPAGLPEERRALSGIAELSTVQAESISALDHSRRMRSILGDPAVDALVAVRAYEHEHYAEVAAGQLADKFRMAWSL